MPSPTTPIWSESSVKSPHLPQPIPVLTARHIPYVPSPNARQSLTIYLPHTPQTAPLINQPATSIPSSSCPSLVHIHGGAWRDPSLTSTSIEAAVTHAFSAPDPAPIHAIISIDYTLSPFPSHPTLPYDPRTGAQERDPSREARYPDHLRDVRAALRRAGQLGVREGGYVLSGHSAGACLAFQAVLGLGEEGEEGAGKVPRPVAVMGLNGLYDIPNLVHGLGPSHEHLSTVYADLIGIAFGTDQTVWAAASPARVDVERLGGRVRDGTAPSAVLVDQSEQDQLVPVNQADTMEARLRKVDGLKVVRGRRCTGVHAAPWEEGYMIWETVQDVLKLL